MNWNDRAHDENSQHVDNENTIQANKLRTIQKKNALKSTMHPLIVEIKPKPLLHHSVISISSNSDRGGAISDGYSLLYDFTLDSRRFSPIVKNAPGPTININID